MAVHAVAVHAVVTWNACARGAGRAGWGAAAPAERALHWAVARPPKFDLTAEIRAHPDFRVKNTEKYVSLRST